MLRKWIERAKWLDRLDLGYALLIILLAALMFAWGYATGRRATPRPTLTAEAPEPPRLEAQHVHQWGKWGAPQIAYGAFYNIEIQTRQCETCGEAQRRRLPDPSK